MQAAHTHWWVILWPAGDITVEGKTSIPSGSSKYDATTDPRHVGQVGSILGAHNTPDVAEQHAAQQRDLRKGDTYRID